MSCSGTQTSREGCGWWWVPGLRGGDEGSTGSPLSQWSRCLEWMCHLMFVCALVIRGRCPPGIAGPGMMGLGLAGGKRG